MRIRLAAFSWLVLATFSPARAAADGGQRMEIMLEKYDHGVWKAIDPGLVLDQSDRVRFRFRTNFDGYLYVTNQSTSGKYEQLFPREETGRENHIVAGKDYQIPSTDAVFRIAGPAGHEIVYWLVTPMSLGEGAPHAPVMAPPGPQGTPPRLTPRCDDAILHSRGDCVDSSAGPKLVPRDTNLPQNLSGAADQSRRDLLFMRQKEKAVISTPAPLTGPVIYEYHLAHR
jgi:hypothetical protein